METSKTLTIPRYIPQVNTKELADVEVTYELADPDLGYPTKYILIEIFCKDVCLTEIVSTSWFAQLTDEVNKVLERENQERIFERRYEDYKSASYSG